MRIVQLLVDKVVVSRTGIRIDMKSLGAHQLAHAVAAESIEAAA
jgi:hypothetical protein